MPLIKADEQIESYALALDKVMTQTEKNLLDVLGGAASASGEFDSTVLLNSQPAMIQALRDAGYFELAEIHVAKFAEIPPETIAAFNRRGLPTPEFSTVDRADFRALAGMDLKEFNNIGISAMNELQLGLVQNAVSSAPFSTMVDAVKAATVGVDGKGSPLSNHAKTHANTAILNFQGETLIKAGESIGFDGPDDLWEAVGPLDSVTRDVCVNALANPVRTRSQWEAIDWWGGTPGGHNCRHQLFPFFEEEVQLLG